jgi:hypothetical protein
VSVAAIRDGLATNLATISGLRTVSTLPENPNPPIAVVAPSSISYDASMGRGLDTYNFTITVVVGRADGRSAQDKLDTYVSSSGSLSVKVAVESDRKLNGQCKDLRVTAMNSYGAITIGEVQYLAAEFDVVVYL